MFVANADLADYQGLRHEVPSREDLDALLGEMAKARDKGKVRTFRRLRNRVVALHLRFALKFARQFRSSGIPLIDLVQVAAMGLLRACDTFEPSRGVAFTTYASAWATHHLRRHTQDHGRTIRIPVHLLDALTKVRRARASHRATVAEPPTIAELAQASGLPESKVRRALEVEARNRPLSLDAPVFDGDETATLAEAIADRDSLDPEATLLAKERETLARKAAAALPDNEAKVIGARFALVGGEEQTLLQVATGPLGGKSRERARQIQQAGLRRMRGSLDPALRLG